MEAPPSAQTKSSSVTRTPTAFFGRSYSSKTLLPVDKKLPLARFCSLTSAKETTATNKGQSAHWDSSVLKSALSATELTDELLLRNLVHGTITSGKLWPLLLDRSPHPLARLRSLEFFCELLRDPTVLSQLDEEQRCFLCVGIRDLWLADSHHLLNEDEHRLLVPLLDLLSEDLFPTGELQHIPFSFCPTKSRRVLRFVERLDEIVDGGQVLDCAAQLRVDTAPCVLYAVWVDARDLSYHNFECILPLDRILHRDGVVEKKVEKKSVAEVRRSKRRTTAAVTAGSEAKSAKKNGAKKQTEEEDKVADSKSSALAAPFDVHPLRLRLSNVQQLRKDMNVFVATLSGDDVALLQQLDQLGLYQQPSNASTRGGERFIFSSAALSSGLSEAVRQSDLLPKLPDDTPAVKKAQPKKTYRNPNPRRLLKDKFKFVNQVFRCNRFAAGDARFELHMDTPYYDAANHHVSKYTILIYLTGGSGSNGQPVLRIGGGEDGKTGPAVSIDRLEAFQCVIFDQRYEHEGRPYAHSPKVFLRSELIFEDRRAQHSPEVGALFSSAVYFTTQSMFQPELSRHAHELYERVNRAHWGIAPSSMNASPPPPPPPPPLMLHKCWQDQVHFATNGFDYYFPYVGKDDTLPADALKICALVAVLDHFNCQVTAEGFKVSEPHSAAFRKFCSSSVIPQTSTTSPSSIVEFLWQQLGAMKKETKQAFQQISKDQKRAYLTKALNADRFRWDRTKEADHCCPFHMACTEADAKERAAFTDEEEAVFVPWKCADVVPDYNDAVEYTTRKLLGAPVLLLNKELHLDPSCVHIADSKVFINSEPTGEPLRVNFAACWNWSSSEAWIDVGATVPAPRLLLPPITFVAIPASSSSGPAFHLLLDFFRNDWVLPVVKIDRKIPIPTYTDAESSDNWNSECPRAPYLDAVKQNAEGDWRSFDQRDGGIHAQESDRELSEEEIEMYERKWKKRRAQIEKEDRFYRKIRGEPVYGASADNSSDE